ncbi:hypothetical protein [Turicibacter sanguinis]|uniref:hypothetical protein n=1 Tax=Turicibacter sanguinis TaxID=154288 RepID=UPI0018AC84CA|nr:hypothetical protein [Turicibacter sanguinis]MDB8551647.1 hypothetical protein [Turicibacter sanguinis]
MKKWETPELINAHAMHTQGNPNCDCGQTRGKHYCHKSERPGNGNIDSDQSGHPDGSNHTNGIHFWSTGCLEHPEGCCCYGGQS